MALPDRPGLEYLKKLAKDRLPELRRTDARARLADAQLAVAREQGFTSKRDDEAGVGRLLDADPPLATARDVEGQTPLLAAVDATRAGLVSVLPSRGADPGGVSAHSARTPSRSTRPGRHASRSRARLHA